MNNETELDEMHWLMGVIHSINVGIIVIDKQYAVKLWNGFMVNRSGKRADEVMGKNLFNLFPELPRNWFERKVESVFTLANRAFTTWEQRPYLFKFKNYRPITGSSPFMYQNITFLPLMGVDGNIRNIGIVIYDVTEAAVGKQKLEGANNELAMLSRTDRLTQLNNRGYWEECLVAEYERYKRTSQPVTLIMFDIDHFKNVNDTYGHQAGDEVIRQTSRTLRRTIRKTDIAGRYGGEEFAVLLVDTSKDNALILAERLRKRIEALTIQYEDMLIEFNISLGVSELNQSIKSYKDWIETADQALYFSKENGRNQTTVYSKEKFDNLKSVG
jgi:diguanylate cyclase (GGDEF)-like protein/PAS domain S-box-containing protein